MVKEGIEALKEVGYLVETELLNPVDFGIPLQKTRWFLRGVHQLCTDKLADIEVPSLLKPACIADILESDENVPEHLFLPAHCRSEIKWCDRPPKSQAEPWIVGRLGPGVGQPAYPHRILHCMHPSLIPLASGNSPWILTMSGSIRRFTEGELAELHGFAKSYRNGEPVSIIRRFLGNCICPPSMRAVLLALKKSIKFSANAKVNNSLRNVNRSEAAPAKLEPQESAVGEGQSTPAGWQKQFGGNCELNAMFDKIKRVQQLRFFDSVPSEWTEAERAIKWQREKKKLYDTFFAIYRRCEPGGSAVRDSAHPTGTHSIPSCNGRGNSVKTFGDLKKLFPVVSPEFQLNRSGHQKTFGDLLKQFPPTPDKLKSIKASPLSVNVEPYSNLFEQTDTPPVVHSPIVAEIAPSEISWRTTVPSSQSGPWNAGSQVKPKAKRLKLHGYMSPAMKSQILRTRSHLISSDIAPTTRKKYDASFDQYLEFCKAANRDPYLSGLNPSVDTETLIQFAC